MSYFITLTVLCCTVLHSCSLVNGGKTLLISLDGFRWDYLQKTDTPNFDKFLSEGSQVIQVTNAFATLTMPNHWTLVTGMYEEDHGIIANKFYDPAWDREYDYSRGSEWYNNTEPIWITAEKEGKKAGAYMWVGNQAKYDGMTATKVIPFSYTNLDLEDSVPIVTKWLSEEGLDLACLYTNQPDSDGHSYGPDSDEVQERIRKIDTVLGKIMKDFDELGLTDKVNILIASDHGMTNVSNSRMINLGAYVDFDNEIEWSYVSAIGLIIPKANQTDQVYNKLKAAESKEPHMTVYRKENIPADLKYKNNGRITEIVVVADPGWLLKRTAGYSTSMLGNHGFDNANQDMKTTFLARGPDFKCNYKQGEMKSVDLYPLLCHLLDLNGCHNSRGNLDSTRDLLTTESCVPTGSAGKSSAAAAMIFSLVAFTILF